VRQKGGLPGPPPRSPSSRIPCCPDPGGLYRDAIARVWLRPELSPVIGVLPGPVTGSNIVNSPTGTQEYGLIPIGKQRRTLRNAHDTPQCWTSLTHFRRTKDGHYCNLISPSGFEVRSRMSTGLSPSLSYPRLGLWSSPRGTTSKNLNTQGSR